MSGANAAVEVAARDSRRGGGTRRTADERLSPRRGRKRRRSEAVEPAQDRFGAPRLDGASLSSHGCGGGLEGFPPCVSQPFVLHSVQRTPLLAPLPAQLASTVLRIHVLPAEGFAAASAAPAAAAAAALASRDADADVLVDLAFQMARSLPRAVTPPPQGIGAAAQQNASAAQRDHPRASIVVSPCGAQDDADAFEGPPPLPPPPPLSPSPSPPQPSLPLQQLKSVEPAHGSSAPAAAIGNVSGVESAAAAADAAVEEAADDPGAARAGQDTGMLERSDESESRGASAVAVAEPLAAALPSIGAAAPAGAAAAKFLVPTRGSAAVQIREGLEAAAAADTGEPAAGDSLPAAGGGGACIHGPLGDTSTSVRGGGQATCSASGNAHNNGYTGAYTNGPGTRNIGGGGGNGGDGGDCHATPVRAQQGRPVLLPPQVAAEDMGRRFEEQEQSFEYTPKSSPALSPPERGEDYQSAEGCLATSLALQAPTMPAAAAAAAGVAAALPRPRLWPDLTPAAVPLSAKPTLLGFSAAPAALSVAATARDCSAPLQAADRSAPRAAGTWPPPPLAAAPAAAAAPRPAPAPAAAAAAAAAATPVRVPAAPVAHRQHESSASTPRWSSGAGGGGGSGGGGSGSSGATRNGSGGSSGSSRAPALAPESVAATPEPASWSGASFFSTAGKKRAVKVSAASLARAEKLLEDVLPAGVSEAGAAPAASSTFQAAGGGGFGSAAGRGGDSGGGTGSSGGKGGSGGRAGSWSAPRTAGLAGAGAGGAAVSGAQSSGQQRSLLLPETQTTAAGRSTAGNGASGVRGGFTAPRASRGLPNSLQQQLPAPPPPRQQHANSWQSGGAAAPRENLHSAAAVACEAAAAAAAGQNGQPAGAAGRPAAAAAGAGRWCSPPTPPLPGGSGTPAAGAGSAASTARTPLPMRPPPPVVTTPGLAAAPGLDGASSGSRGAARSAGLTTSKVANPYAAAAGGSSNRPHSGARYPPPNSGSGGTVSRQPQKAAPAMHGGHANGHIPAPHTPIVAGAVLHGSGNRQPKPLAAAIAARTTKASPHQPPGGKTPLASPDDFAQPSGGTGVLNSIGGGIGHPYDQPSAASGSAAVAAASEAANSAAKASCSGSSGGSGGGGALAAAQAAAATPRAEPWEAPTAADSYAGDTPKVRFQSGRGTVVIVSEESLQKVQHIFDDDGDGGGGGSAGQKPGQQPQVAPVAANVAAAAVAAAISAAGSASGSSPGFSFRSGRGNVVKASEEARRQVQHLFEDEQEGSAGAAAKALPRRNHHSSGDAFSPSRQRQLLPAPPGAPAGRETASDGASASSLGQTQQKPETTNGHAEIYAGGELGMQERPTGAGSAAAAAAAAMAAGGGGIGGGSAISTLKIPFRSGLGGAISISDESREKVRHIFDDDGSDGGSAGPLLPPSRGSSLSSGTSLPGSATAGMPMPKKVMLRSRIGGGGSSGGGGGGSGGGGGGSGSGGGGGGSGSGPLGASNRENEAGTAADGAVMRECAAGLRTPFGGAAANGLPAAAGVAAAAGARTPLPSHKLHFASPQPQASEAEQYPMRAAAAVMAAAPVAAAAGAHAAGVGTPQTPRPAPHTTVPLHPAAARAAREPAASPRGRTPAQNPYAASSGRQKSLLGASPASSSARQAPFELSENSVFDLTPAHQPRPRKPLKALGAPAGQSTLEDVLARGVPATVARVTRRNALLLRFGGEEDGGLPCCIDGQGCRGSSGGGGGGGGGGVGSGGGGGSCLHLPAPAGTPPELAQNGLVAELRDALLGCGALPGQCSPLWVANHATWVVWKLAAMERSHPAAYGGKLLRRAHVVRQLRYRYEVEVLQARSSALKAVLQGDAGASGVMILCVSQVHLLPPSPPQTATTLAAADTEIIAGNAAATTAAGTAAAAAAGAAAAAAADAPVVLELTDGWHAVDAWLEGALAFYVRQNRIAVGSKLAIAGAILEATGPAVVDPGGEGEARRQWARMFSPGGGGGRSDGFDPLELSSRRVRSVLPPGAGPCLRLAVNGTRLARWDAKLGFWRPKIHQQLGGSGCSGGSGGGASGASTTGMVLPLCSLVSGGGVAPAVDVLVHRRYPLLYMESGSGGGGSGPRTPGRMLTEAENEAVRERYEAACQQALEAAAGEMQAEGGAADEFSGGGVAASLYRRVMQSPNPSAACEALSEPERRLMFSWRDKWQQEQQQQQQRAAEAVLAQLPGAGRRVTLFVTLRVTCMCGGSGGDGGASTGRRAPHRPRAALVRIWEPPEASLQALAEGSRVRLLRVDITGGVGDLRVSLGRKSAVEVVAAPAAGADLAAAGYWQRQGVPLVDLGLPQGLLLPCDDLDMALCLVLVTRVDPGGHGEATLPPGTPRAANEDCRAATGQNTYHIYLTDGSGQLLRVSRQATPAQAACCRVLRAQSGSLWAFANLAVDLRQDGSRSGGSSMAVDGSDFNDGGSGGGGGGGGSGGQPAQLLGRWTDFTTALIGTPGATTSAAHLASPLTELRAWSEAPVGKQIVQRLRNGLLRWLSGDYTGGGCNGAGGNGAGGSGGSNGGCGGGGSESNDDGGGNKEDEEALAAMDVVEAFEPANSLSAGEQRKVAPELELSAEPAASAAAKAVAVAAEPAAAAPPAAIAVAAVAPTLPAAAPAAVAPGAAAAEMAAAAVASPVRTAVKSVEQQPGLAPPAFPDTAGGANAAFTGSIMGMRMPAAVAAASDGGSTAAGTAGAGADLSIWLGDGDDSVEILLPKTMWQQLLEVAMAPADLWPPGSLEELVGINTVMAKAQTPLPAPATAQDAEKRAAKFRDRLQRRTLHAVFCLLLGAQELPQRERLALLRVLAAVCGGSKLCVRAEQAVSAGGGGAVLRAVAAERVEGQGA